MDAKAILFERPLVLIVLMLVVQFALTQIWSMRRTRRTGKLAAGWLLAIPVVMTVQHLVVTDREHIADRCRRLADAVRRRDVQGILNQLNDPVRLGDGDQPLDQTELAERFSRVLARWEVQQPRLSSFKFVVQGDAGTVEFNAGCRLVSSEHVVPWFVSRWRLALRRTPGTTGGWKVSRIAAVKTGRWNINPMAELLR